MAAPEKTLNSSSPLVTPESDMPPPPERLAADAAGAQTPPLAAHGLPAAPTQNVTVVQSFLPPAPKPQHRRTWAVGGGLVGSIVGVGLGYSHFTQQPAEYEAAARLWVSGGSAAAEAAGVRSPRVVEAAARKLDGGQPLADRVAFINDHLAATADGADVVMSVRGPHAGDATKALRAVAEVYQADVAARAAAVAVPPASAPQEPTPQTPAPAPPVPVAPVPKSSPRPDELAAIDAELGKRAAELQQLTTEDVAAIQTRLAADRPALEQVRRKQGEADRALAAIRATGPARGDRLVTMAALGVKADAAPPPPPPAPPELLSRILAAQEKKAELGLRLGPDHRDMVALDEQINFLQARLPKSAPAAKTPDELDRHRAAVEAERVALVARAGVLAAAVERDEKTVQAVTTVRAELDRLATARRAAESRPKAADPAPAAVTPAVPAPAVQADPPPVVAAPELPVPLTVTPVVAPSDAVRVSPLLYRSLVPGGLLGALAGAALGLLASSAAALVGTVAGSRGSKPPRPAPAPAKITPPRRPARSPKATAAAPRLGLPVLGQIPALRTDLPVERRSAERLDPSLVCFYRPSGEEAEAFRAARREVTAALQHRGHQIITVTSPGGGDGKSTVAANLAVALAQAGKRVILVDCDFRTARVQHLFRLIRLGDSLKAVMTADVDLRVAVRTCEVPNLFLLPAGRGVADPLDLVTRPKFRELLAELRERYEYVILDAPPTTAGQEVAALAGHGDGSGAVLVVRAGADATERTAHAKERLIGAGVHVLGAVTNAAPARPDAVPPPEPAVPVTDRPA